MPYRGRFLLVTSFVALMLGLGLRAQDDNARRPDARNTSRPAQAAEPSDLAQENMGRVAAAAPQIQAVLLQDAGILVELKRWVAKEATNNGQVVEDSLLTDQAIFDRLDHDVEFRSVATRLVQRYGYLLPSVNPESEVAEAARPRPERTRPHHGATPGPATGGSIGGCRRREEGNARRGVECRTVRLRSSNSIHL